MKESREGTPGADLRAFGRPARGEAPGGTAGPTWAQGEPRIAAFIWGGKIRPVPTLPYGRWKGAA